MKIVRFILILAGLAIGAAGLLVLVAIAPVVQTWVAQHELAGGAEVKGTIDSLSAGFGELNIEGLRLESSGNVLTLPTFQAKFPVTEAIWRRRVRVRSLVADGWTLDLSHASGDIAAPRDAALVIASLIRPWNLPFDLSLDDLEMEGDVITPAGESGVPGRMHLRITGGGLAGGREGTFMVETTGDIPGAPTSSLSAHGTLAITMETPRAFSRIRLSGGISGLGNASLGDLKLTATADIAAGAGEETFGVDLARGERRLASVSTHLPTEKGRIEGTWRADLLDSDFSPFAPDLSLPSVAAQGSGTFESDTAFSTVHVAGGLSAVVGKLGSMAPQLERVGRLGVTARFDLVHSGQSAHFASLGIKLAGSRPLADIRALQGFDVDEKAGSLSVPDSRDDWIEVSVVGFPLSWIEGATGPLTLSGDDASGAFLVHSDGASFTFRPRGALTASHLLISKGGRAVLDGADVSASLSGGYAPSGWEVRFAPLVVSKAGRELARVEGKVAHAPGTDQPLSVTGKWSADMGSLASQSVFPVLAGFSGGTAAGDFTAAVTDSVDVQGKVVLTGKSGGNSLESSYHAEFDGVGGTSFVVPVKLTTGDTVSDITTEGTWVRSKDSDQLDLKLGGTSVSLEHLRILAAAMAALGGGLSPASPTSRDVVPFWGDWSGHVTVALDRLKLRDSVLFVVGGVLDIDGGTIRLTQGHGGPEHHNVTNIVGSLSFDAKAPMPYSLQATATGFEIEAATLFKAPHSDEDPVFDGRFQVAPSLSGEGVNLPDLADRFREVFRITSTVGIVRILRADVASSLREKAAPVKDTLGSVGSAVGLVFGVDKQPDFAAKNKLSKPAEAALDLQNQLAEIGCDLITVVAKRGPDGSIEIASIAADAPDEFIRGSGRIAFAPGVALLDLPLSLDLQIGARGHVADLLATAGLAAAGQDEKGFTLVGGPVHFGGSLGHLDGSAWQAMLVRAASR